MNSQSCASAVGLVPAPISAGPNERAGLTETPVTLMPTMWMATSVKPMARPARCDGAPSWVTPRMVTRKRKVAIASNTKADIIEYSPR